MVRRLLETPGALPPPSERLVVENIAGQLMGSAARRPPLQGALVYDPPVLRDELRRLVECDRFWDLLAETHAERLSEDLLELIRVFGERAPTPSEMEVARDLGRHIARSRVDDAPAGET
jgi:hypothetical protein